MSKPDGERSVGELVFDVSEKTSLLVREEIELAKAEITEKVSSLLRGGAVALVAGTFAIAALILIMHGVAWLLDDLFFGDKLWLGFFVEAGIFLLVGAGAGFYAYRALRKGAPPTPDMAISEAREIRASFEGSSGASDAADAQPPPSGGGA